MRRDLLKIMAEQKAVGLQLPELLGQRGLGDFSQHSPERTLIESLTIPTRFAAMGASNAFQLQGDIPQDRDALLAALDKIVSTVGEEELRAYRRTLPHL